MDTSHIEKLLHALGCERIRAGNTGWVYATCPLLFRHVKGTDTKPSFAISIVPNGESHYKCHACNAVGTLNGLLWAIQKKYKRDVSALMRMVQTHNVPSPEDLMARLNRINDGGYSRSEPAKVAGVQISPRLADSFSANIKLEVLPESTLVPFKDIPPYVLKYLLGPRRMTSESTREWELGWHSAVKRISIPIRDAQNALVGISGRAFFDRQVPKYLHSSGFRRDFYLYGEHKVKRGVRGYLCEGFFDVIYLHMLGYNAVAMMGAHLSRLQAEKLTQFFSDLVVVPDGDAPGYEAAEKVMLQVGSRIPTTIAKVPEGKDPDELDSDELISILGPTDLHQI